MIKFFPYSKVKLLFIPILLVFTVASCILSNNDLVPLDQEFTKIYSEGGNNIQVFNMHEHPQGTGYYLFGSIDSLSDENEGIEVSESYPYIIQVDKRGNVVWDTVLYSYFYPLDDNEWQANWIEANGHLYAITQKGENCFFGANNCLEVLDFDPIQRTVSDFNQLEKWVFGSQATFIADPRDTEKYNQPHISFGKASESSLIVGRLSCEQNSASNGYYLSCIDLDGQILWGKTFPTASTNIQNGVLDNCVRLQHPQIQFYNNGQQRFVYLSLIVWNTTTGIDGDSPLAYAVYRINPDNGSLIDQSFYMGASFVDLINTGDTRKMPLRITDASSDKIQIATLNLDADGHEILYPQLDITPNDKTIIDKGSNAANVPTFTSREYDLTKPMLIRDLFIQGQLLTLYFGSTNEGQVLVTVFAKVNDQLILKKKEYLIEGGTLYEITGFILTDDGGFALCGKTSLSGRSENIFLWKYSSSTLQQLIQ